MPKHYVEVSDEVWKELVRVQKATKVDKHALVDDCIALAGDLEAVAENHEEVAVEKAQAEPKIEHQSVTLGDNNAQHSTRAAVLEPTQLELTLDDLI